MEALKTMYLPAFEHLMLLINSGVIGDVKDIDVSCSQCPAELDMDDKFQGSMYDFGSYALLPILQILDTEYNDFSLYSNEIDGFSKFAKGNINYTSALATFRVGKGLKTEGEMIITGSAGYIYVPAPWWKLNYFEVRYEDLRNTKKYFYNYEGEGLRYELNEFIYRINNQVIRLNKYKEKALISATKIIEAFDQKNVIQF